MRNKRSRQIVTGILAVILIVTMLVGVVAPVFAAEDGGAEALFDYYETDNDYGDLWIISSSTNKSPHLGSMELLMKQETSTLWGTDKWNGLKCVIGNNDIGYAPLIYVPYELTDEFGNSTGEFEDWLELSKDSCASINEAIKSASVIKSEVVVHVPSNPKGISNKSDYEKFLQGYLIYAPLYNFWRKNNAQGTFRSIISLQTNPYERE